MKTILSFLTAIAFTGTSFAHVNLLNPQGGETFTVGETVTLQWQIAISHTLQNWDLYFSDNGGAVWDTIQVDIPSTGNAVGTIVTYEWVVPNLPTSQAMIWIYMDNAGTDYDDTSPNFTIQLNTGIEDIGGVMDLAVHPNPVELGGKIYFEQDPNSKSELKVGSFDIRGRSMTEVPINDHDQHVAISLVDLGIIRSGIYILTITDGTGAPRKARIVVQ